MTTTISALSTLPTAPTRDVSSSEFIDLADDFLPALNTLQTEFNTSIGQINAVSDEISDIATSAESAASAAIATANATIYAAGIPYAAGAKVLDPDDNYASYTSQQGGNTGHTPNTDDGTWWIKTVMLVGEMLKDYGYVFVDKGNSGTTTQTIDHSAGSHQKITATGNHTIATSTWPPTGNLGELLLELVNGGAYTITWPTISWIKPDGTTTTNISDYLTANIGRTALQSSGTDFILLWSRDAGTTVMGRLV